MTSQGETSLGRNARRHGLTLLEVLAVIMLISLVGGSVLMHAGTTVHDATRHELLLQLQQLDRTARQLARTRHSGPVTVHIGTSAVTLTSAAQGQTVRRAEVPLQVSLNARDNADQPVSQVLYDRSGRSMDYRVHICGDDGCLTLLIHGLTGVSAVSKDLAGARKEGAPNR
ncbi:MAG: type II secretion system protein [Phycisphaerales bacterium]|nr:MAG: type II secretion system protein [Phycisphaerales bacterium]